MADQKRRGIVCGGEQIHHRPVDPGDQRMAGFLRIFRVCLTTTLRKKLFLTLFETEDQRLMTNDSFEPGKPRRQSRTYGRMTTLLPAQRQSGKCSDL